PKTRKLNSIRKLIRQVEMFGFHLATLDIRNDSGEHEAAVSELLKTVHITDDYSSFSEVVKQKVLIRVITDTRSQLISNDGYSKGTQDMLAIFKLIKNAHVEFGKRSIEVYLVSMTEEPSDLLEVLLLAKEAGIYRLYPDGTVESDLDVAPLLETIDDLIAGPEIMSALFEADEYRKELEARKDHQAIMLGYSDGSKDGGTLSANWKLFKAQQEIHDMAKQYDIRLKFFHDSVELLGRGG